MITEKKLIDHCALTLSSLKTASLFTIQIEDKKTLAHELLFWNDQFVQRGIKIVLLKVGVSSALVYMYREDMLSQDMNNIKAKAILAQYGYEDLTVTEALEMLSKRLSTYDEFPHEIGLFLGYPPEDVEGFICNRGRNCNLCKYWKVYGNEDEALLKFAKYDKCKAVYKKLWQEGYDILKLTVKKQAVA